MEVLIFLNALEGRTVCRQNLHKDPLSFPADMPHWMQTQLFHPIPSFFLPVYPIFLLPARGNLFSLTVQPVQCAQQLGESFV